MYIGIICDIENTKPVGVIAINNGSIGFITNSDSLDDSLDIILDKHNLGLDVEETIDNNNIIREEIYINKKNNYMVAINYHLPYPYRILAVREEGGDMQTVLMWYIEKLNQLEVEV